MRYPTPLIQLIAHLKKLPGVGSKSAERFAFQLLSWPENDLKIFAETLSTLKEKIHHCPECHCLMEGADCHFCNPDKRDRAFLCLISSPKDAYVLEETRTYRGFYHVLGGLLSPLDGRTPQHLDLIQLKNRIAALQTREIILALDSTIEGDATSFYLKEELAPLGLKVSRLAFGLPMGSPLEYVDGGTLSRAFTGRQLF